MRRAKPARVGPCARFPSHIGRPAALVFVLAVTAAGQAAPVSARHAPVAAAHPQALAAPLPPRQLPVRESPGAARVPVPQKSEAPPDLNNPLKRHRMAMPGGDASGFDYAF